MERERERELFVLSVWGQMAFRYLLTFSIFFPATIPNEVLQIAIYQ